MEFIDARQAALLPIQHLAWIGDAVYELYSRQNLVLGGVSPGRPAQRASAKLTSAQGQAQTVATLGGKLTEDERNLFKRGRNAKGLPRNTPDYCQATGLEVVIGWLWLSNKHQRLEELFAAIFTRGGTNEG